MAQWLTVIDATGLKVYGEGEWKIRKHGKEKRRVWRKLHRRRCGDPCHRCSRSQPETVGDNEVLPTLLNPLRRKIEQVSADGAYDTRACYALLQRRAPRPPYRREKCGILEDRPSTQRGGCRAQGRRTGAMEKDSGYHQRSIAETAMYRFKQLIGPKLSLRATTPVGGSRPG